MMYCKQCGKEVEGSETLCPFCGSPLDNENPMPEQPGSEDTEPVEEAAFKVFVFTEDEEESDPENTPDGDHDEDSSSMKEHSDTDEEDTSDFDEEAHGEGDDEDVSSDDDLEAGVEEEFPADAEQEEAAGDDAPDEVENDTPDPAEDHDADEEEEEEEEDDEEYEKKPRNVKRILILLLIVVLAAGAFAGFQYWSYKSSEIDKEYKESDFKSSEITLTINGTYDNMNIFNDRDKTAKLVRDIMTEDLNKESKCVSVSRLEYLSEIAYANVYYYYGQIRVKDMEAFKKQLDDSSDAKSWQAEDPIYARIQVSSFNNGTVKIIVTLTNDNHKS